MSFNVYLQTVLESFAKRTSVPQTLYPVEGTFNTRLQSIFEGIIKLKDELDVLKPQMAAAAQIVYDEWDGDDEFSGGICDEIASAISGIIANNIDASVRDWGHDGDEHAAVIVKRANEQYVVDIPYGIYEDHLGFMTWRKISGIIFSPDHIIISAI
jgi:hypothetical protein